jgi:hypothetical protein
VGLAADVGFAADEPVVGVEHPAAQASIDTSTNHAIQGCLKHLNGRVILLIICQEFFPHPRMVDAQQLAVTATRKGSSPKTRKRPVRMSVTRPVRSSRRSLIARPDGVP